MAEKQVEYDVANRTINGIPELYFYYTIKYGDKKDGFVSLDVLSGEFMTGRQEDDAKKKQDRE